MKYIIRRLIALLPMDLMNNLTLSKISDKCNRPFKGNFHINWIIWNCFRRFNWKVERLLLCFLNTWWNVERSLKKRRSLWVWKEVMERCSNPVEYSSNQDKRWTSASYISTKEWETINADLMRMVSEMLINVVESIYRNIS